MANQVRLQNLIGRTALVGQIVKLAPNSTKAYVLADTPDPDAIGTVAEQTANGYWGLVDLIGNVSSLDAVADGTYVLGLGTTTNGTITLKGGIITSLTQAT